MNVIIGILSLALAVVGIAGFYFAYKVIKLMSPHVSSTIYDASQVTKSQVQPSDVDQIIDEDKETVPLDQFNPDFSKPLKIVRSSDEEGNEIVEEVEDTNDQKVRNYASN